MYYHYDSKTKEFLFESIEQIDDYPSTEIDIIFDLPLHRHQIFDGKKWIKIYDYRKANVYKKNSNIKVFKKLGEKIEDDEIVFEDTEYEPNIEYQPTDHEKEIIKKIEINGFLAKTDKYFNGHPPKYNGDLEKLKRYREYLYNLTEERNWWQKNIFTYEEWT